jgi:SagB-type dehydrogenase family enzyme
VQWLGLDTSQLPEEASVAVALARPGDEALLVELDERCAQLGIPWLRAALHGTEIEVGPLFDRAHTPCFGCFLGAQGRLPLEEPPPWVRELCTGIVAMETTHLLGRVCATLAFRGMARLETTAWTQQQLVLTAQPGCPTCLPHSAKVPGQTPLALAYEYSIAFPPRKLLNPKDHQHHYRLANLSLQRDAKRYPSAPLVSLPPSSELPPAQGVFSGGSVRPPRLRSAELGLPVLGALLERSFGLRDGGVAAVPGKVQRWAPTGGNLGSPQAYVLAGGVEGLRPGAYCYLPNENALASQKPDRDAAAVERLVRKATGGALTGTAPAVLVLTGALARVSSKYMTFAYRIVNLDAGCALAQLRAVAAGYGLTVRRAPSWDDHLLLEELGLNGDSEPITAVVEIQLSGVGDDDA